MTRPLLRLSICIALAIFMVSQGLSSTLIDMARSQQWSTVLQVARIRAQQLPLSAGECLVAAYAAEMAHENELQRMFLARALGDDKIAQVAAVELAQEVVDESPEHALDLVGEVLQRPASRTLRARAVEVAAKAFRGLSIETLQVREKDLRALRLPLAERRRLELAVVSAAREPARRRLVRLLQRSTADLVALEAAEGMQDLGELPSTDTWLVASTFFQHALYARTEPLLEQLFDAESTSVPRSEVAFMRGRCAFRRGRWDEATTWYNRALKHAVGREQRAEYEVHVARSHELAGRLDEALDAAVHAVRIKTTDDRRLFLARLRLRNDELAKAEFGVAQIRRRSDRDRGQMLLSLHQLKAGDEEGAKQRLLHINRPPWRGPAAVLVAQLDAANGAWGAMLEHLDRSASALEPYWAARARVLVAAAPQAEVNRWRHQLGAELADLSGARLIQRIAARAVLEIDATELERVAARVLEVSGLSPVADEPAFANTLAARLWELGLPYIAVRWDAHGFPKATAAESYWSAQQLVRYGAPDRAISMADTGWRQALPQVPLRAYPRDLQLAAYPLPSPTEVRSAAAEAGLPWTLLAGVAREESRWQPQTLSVVGARGLMQLMPATAEAVARRLGMPLPDRDELFESRLSLRLGAAELQHLLERFDGRVAVAVAAYNAGEAQAQQWLDQCGAGCTEERFVQSVSFSATRGYVEHVLASAAAYGELYALP